VTECWAITDSAAGNERQVLALAGQLGLPARHLVMRPRAPWSWLAPRMTVGGRLAVPVELRHAFAPPWPGFAIGCGRGAALFTRLLRTLSDGRCRVVQILDPRIDPRHWDLVVAPRHDGLDGANVLTSLGALNPVDDAWLAAGRDATPGLGELPRPRVGVLLGGPRHGAAPDLDYARRLGDGLLARYRRESGSVLLLASRRTPAVVFALLRDMLRGIPGLAWGGSGDGPNPYPGVLGWADRLVATPDSVNMLSEACAVGCAVHTLADARLPAKLARFHAALREHDLLHDLDADAPLQQVPLRETAAIAAEVRRRLLLAP
jgi:mitochondrial fission protein ELM1